MRILSWRERIFYSSEFVKDMDKTNKEIKELDEKIAKAKICIVKKTKTLQEKTDDLEKLISKALKQKILEIIERNKTDIIYFEEESKEEIKNQDLSEYRNCLTIIACRKLANKDLELLLDLLSK